MNVLTFLETLPLYERNRFFQSFRTIKLTDGSESYLLSVQGSSFHMSSPKQNLDKLTDYRIVEVCISENELDSPIVQKLTRMSNKRIAEQDTFRISLANVLADLFEFAQDGGTLSLGRCVTCFTSENV